MLEARANIIAQPMGLIDGRAKFSFDLRHMRSYPEEVAANHVTLVTERRLTFRIEAPFPGRLKGLDSTGRVFTEHSVLDNLSNGGLHMCVMRDIPLGVEVTVAVRLSADGGFAPVLRLAARGTVVRTEPRADGCWGVAVEFTRRRIL